MRVTRLALFGSCLILAVGYGVAKAVVFANTTPITIGSNSSPQAASPYPSNISVSGLGGSITDVNVTLHNLSHTYPDDIDVLVAGPGGQRMILMADAGGEPDANNVTLTFDDQAASQIPADGTLATGTWRPGNFAEDPGGCTPGTDTFPAPAPAAPYGTTLSAFNGLSGANLNGTWSLYVVDDCLTFTGTIAGGWSLDILTTTPTAARLRSFQAAPSRGETVLRWRTGSELGVAGFNVYRAVAGRRTRLNGALIRARGGSAGATYRFEAKGTPRTVVYRLELVELDGRRSWAGTALVAAR